MAAARRNSGSVRRPASGLLVQAEAVGHVRGLAEQWLVAVDQALLAELTKTAVALRPPVARAGYGELVEPGSRDPGQPGVLIMGLVQRLPDVIGQPAPVGPDEIAVPAARSRRPGVLQAGAYGGGVAAVLEMSLLLGGSKAAARGGAARLRPTVASVKTAKEDTMASTLLDYRPMMAELRIADLLREAAAARKVQAARAAHRQRGV